MDDARTLTGVDGFWEEAVLPALCDFIRIPALSPLFDPSWQEAGHLDRAVDLAEAWCRQHAPEDASVEVVRLEGRSPVLLLDVPGAVDATVMLYGHLDKQPEMTGWADHLGPWEPVREGDKLYGRGSVDDGYAVFSAVAALRALREQGVPHARCLVLVETGEESGSPDLPAYMDALAGRLGTPDLIVALDSGCGTYDRLWLTTSLRGLLMADLRVDVVTEGVHSGDAGGAVPSSFRILRHLLSRLEDDATGRLLLDELHVEVPEQRARQAEQASDVMGDDAWKAFPFVEGAGPGTEDPLTVVLRRTWEPSLAITGADGLPPLARAGNVLRPFTALKLSLRLPPTCDPTAALRGVREVLVTEPPYGARVSLSGEALQGWNAPDLAPWLERSVEAASRAYFGPGAVAMGEGGTIPFMALLGQRFPKAQFLITGVMGPGANAHGPNEFLHLPAVKRLTASVARVLADHAAAVG